MKKARVLAAMVCVMAVANIASADVATSTQLFFDDFNGTALDTSRWSVFVDIHGVYNWPYVAGGLLHSQGYHTRIDSIPTFAPMGQSVMARARIRLAGDYHQFGFGVNPNERAGPITGYYFDTYNRFDESMGREDYVRALAWFQPASGSPINLLDVEIPVTWYEFHEFAIERTPSEVIYSIDAQEVARVSDAFAGALPVCVWNARWDLMQTDWVEVSQISEPEWSFVQMTDTQFGSLTVWGEPIPNWTNIVTAETYLAKTIHMANHSKSKPDFILDTGDIVDHVGYYGVPSVGHIYYFLYLEALKSLDPAIKVYTVPGNHDRYTYECKSISCLKNFPDNIISIVDLGLYDNYVNQRRPSGTEDLVTPYSYAFEHKGLKFIGLDSGPGRNEGELLEGQWLALGGVNAEIPKVVFMHHPSLGNQQEDFNRYCETNHVQLVLEGHTHKAADSTVNGVQYIQTPSTTGAWWGAMPVDEPGYRQIYVKNGKTYPQQYTRTTTLLDMVIAALYSPASLHVYDTDGRHIGTVDGNEVERGIPDSFYFSHQVLPTEDGNETLPEKIMIFDPCDDYLYEVVGKETGTYRLEIILTVDGNDTVFEANGIPTLPGAVHDYLIDWDLLAQGSNGVTLLVDADGDGTFERTITSDSNLTAVEFDQKPIAEAGQDQTVYAWIDGKAKVTLDGSDSNDPDGDALTYKWTWSVGADTYEANGVSPTIELPVGVHTIQLVVNDGLVDSAADEVNVTVIAPVQGNLCVMPSTINRRSNQPHILAAIELDNIAKSDINADESLTLYPGGIKATKQWLITCKDRRGKLKTTIFAFFDKDDLMAAVPRNGITPLKVAGKLKSGQYFYGCDTVRIIDWKWQWPWCQW